MARRHRLSKKNGPHFTGSAGRFYFSRYSNSA
ncbi:hypothetical protein ALO95_102059 [Pseudomonas syringae pv. antirrhini]|uniref:Uncharacterized protein n=5 Tax=Pseudomonas syringae group TaxID=136849 RepID=A0A3M3MCW4_9PSED|nr:hypothetical protein ALO88_102444 [Pseudomonas syringae pv. antirrhini]KPW47208.1 hypothetical protein ALO86_101987 [Pseudomonas syringae pv. berberidis]KPX70536.1 hypothetical protein ALO84_102018 [Pseudomonas syringae pv. maculicola]KPY18976.1 hypothetical protein ALO54_102235 [Pseudomonas syringae pv. philadelphi]KPY96017.1 hypothetical protein ALO36_103592 [Pseudomonas syringae pv. tomato]RMM10400.1 hypothetical protein ALQ85_102305 [Pseudomonas syringae]RMN45225.1 hypothetical protein